jgi:hypothetical protein
MAGIVFCSVGKSLKTVVPITYKNTPSVKSCNVLYQCCIYVDNERPTLQTGVAYSVVLHKKIMAISHNHKIKNSGRQGKYGFALP